MLDPQSQAFFYTIILDFFLILLFLLITYLMVYCKSHTNKIKQFTQEKIQKIKSRKKRKHNLNVK